jgi:hypothetical protein
MYAHFGKFMLKVDLNGMASASDADASAASFLGFYDAKTR